MTRLYMIRHAEAEGNLYRIAQGQYNSILTDRGWQQVAALERRFREIPVDAVYSSDLYRTCATASAIYRPKGLTLQRRKALREICVGKWEQKTWGEIAREEPQQLEYFNHQLHLWHVKGAETPQEVQDRMVAEVRRIARENEGKTAAVFSHGCAIRLLLAQLQGYSLEELGQTPHGDNTAVSLLEGTADDLRVVFRDDNSHLKDLPAPGRRPNALEPGMYFLPLVLPDQQLFWSACAQQAGLDEKQAEAGLPARVGYLGDEAAGVIQFQPEKEAETGRGWIALLSMTPWRQGSGYGVQLLGQAVQFYRPLGRTHLRLALKKEQEAACRFLCRYGFVPVGMEENGREIWEKDISYQAEFLSGD